MSRYTVLTSIVLAFAVVGGCGRLTEDPAVCKPTLERLAPTAASTFKTDAGKVVKFHAECKTCKENESFSMRWMLNNEIVSYSNDYSFIACNEDAGVHKLSAQAITYATTDTASVEKVLANHTWNITVRNVSKPKPPKCYAQSIENVRNIQNADLPEEQVTLQNAVDCLDGYLKTYVCDFPASYASGFAKLALMGESLYPLYKRRATLNLADIQALVDKKIEPIRQNFLVVQQKAPDDFAFYIDGFFKIYFFHDDPLLEGDDTVYVNAYGRHDKGEILVVLTFMNWFDGFLGVGFAEKGSLEFGAHIPDNSTPASLSTRLIEAIEADASFFTFDDGKDDDGKQLKDGKGKEGKRLIDLTQNSFIEGLKQMSAVFDEVRSEKHDQSQDPIRYWDCGGDGICPTQCSYMDGYFNTGTKADKAEYNATYYASCELAEDSYDDRNLNGKCDEAWTSADAGECNGKYDEGEAMGSDRIGFGNDDPERQGPPLSIEKIQEVFKMFEENIRGPNALDLDKLGMIAGDLPNKAVSGGLRGFGIPYPEIRISEFFDTPSSFRELLPLYSRVTKQFIIDAENEPFKDFGYDGIESANENGFVAVTNIDPNHDDFDPICNPDCNQRDLFDNDGDGKIDQADARSGIPKDLGIEGNFVFDFIDLPQGGNAPNGIHDPGEPGEPYDDVGTINSSGKSIGSGNNFWDKADRAHKWPTGSNIGPVQNIDLEEDPPNGTTLEIGQGGLYDYYYYFLQDAAFSGSVHFVVDPYNPELDMTSTNGVSLTDNARLQRFMSKLIETVGGFGFRETNAHPCDKPVANCNHWSTGSYQ